MSEKFSATLRIGDLNDFIAPSQACIVSLKGLKATTTKPDKVEVLFRFRVPIAAKVAADCMLLVIFYFALILFSSLLLVIYRN